MNVWILLGGVNAALAVAAGAYGWHGLAETPDVQRIFLLGTQYHMWHALGLIAAGLLYARSASKAFAIAGGLFQAGIILFSGTLYTFATPIMVPINGAAPVGGGLWMLGWLVLGVAGAKHAKVG